MHALVARVSIDPTRGEEARRSLDEMVVPMAKKRAGFQGGYWLRSLDGSTGLSVELYDTEESARAVADTAPQMPPDAPVQLESVEVYSVEAHA